MGKISMPQGKGSQLHNRRDYEKIGKDFPDNIDKSTTDQNITIVDKEVGGLRITDFAYILYI